LIFTYEIFPKLGGIQKYIYKFAQVCGKEMGSENVVVVPFSGKYEKNPYFKIMQILTVFPWRIKFLLGKLFMRFLLKKYRFNLVVFNHITFAYFGKLVQKLKVPYFVIVYGIEVWRELSNAEIEFLQKASLVISISEFTKNILIERGIEESKIKVIHYGIDTDKFKPVKGDKLKKVFSGGSVLLTVTRLSASERYKGYDRVIEVLPKLKEDFSDIKYIIVGDGDDKTRVIQLSQRLNVKDAVILAGVITDEDNLVEYYNLCNVYVMPSEFSISKNRIIGEGLGMVYLEAAACGKPVIAGKGGGCQEAVKDGVTGFLVDPNNLEELYNAIYKLLKDKNLAEDMGLKGRKRIENNFSEESFATKIKEIISGEVKWG